MLTRSLHISLWLATLLTIVGFALQSIRAIDGTANPEPIERLISSQAIRIAHHDPPSLAADLSVLPGLPMLVAPFVRPHGARPWSARAISLVAILVTAVLIVLIVWGETRHGTLAVTSGGLALAGFTFLAGQPEEARPEPLMMAFVLAGFLALRREKNAWATLSAGFLLATACLVDSKAAWFVAAGLLGLAIEHRRRLLVFVLGVGLAATLGYAMTATLAGPWLTPAAWRATLDSFTPSPGPLLQYVGNQVLGTLGVLTLTALLSLALPTRTGRGPGGVWMHMGLAAVVAGMIATQRSGYGPEAMIPTVAALVVVGPISAYRLTQHLAAWPGSTRLGGQGVLLTAMALQYFMLFSCLGRLGDPRF